MHFLLVEFSNHGFQALRVLLPSPLASASGNNRDFLPQHLERSRLLTAVQIRPQ
jgi:hypothetical protein